MSIGPISMTHLDAVEALAIAGAPVPSLAVLQTVARLRAAEADLEEANRVRARASHRDRGDAGCDVPGRTRAAPHREA